MIDKLNDGLRKLIDNCNNVQGLVINHCVCGGTGLGSLILERIAVDYRRKSKLGFKIYLSPTILLDALLTTQVSVVFDNEAIYEIYQKWFDRKRPSFDNLNRLITKTISLMKASLRFEDELNVHLNEWETNLVQFPPLHFMTDFNAEEDKYMTISLLSAGGISALPISTDIINWMG